MWWWTTARLPVAPYLPHHHRNTTFLSNHPTLNNNHQVIYRQHFGPLMPGVHIAQYPYCLHCKWQEAKGHYG